jgi:hypothetical protein
MSKEKDEVEPDAIADWDGLGEPSWLEPRLGAISEMCLLQLSSDPSKTVHTQFQGLLS